MNIGFNGVFNDLAKQETKQPHAGNHEYKETDSKNSVQSSLKSHPFWLTLYLSLNLHLLKFNQRNILFAKEDLTFIFYLRQKKNIMLAMKIQILFNKEMKEFLMKESRFLMIVYIQCMPH